MKRLALYVSSLRRGGAERIALRMARALSDRYEVILLVNTVVGDQSYDASDCRVINLDMEKRSVTAADRVKHNISRLAKLRKVIKDQELECVIAFGTKQSVLLCFLKLFTNVKLVAYEQTVVTVSRLGSLWYNLFRVFYRLTDQIVIQTEEGKALLPERYQKRAQVIGNPIELPDEDRYSHIAKEDKAVALGRLVPVKGFDYMIDVFAESADRHDWNLEIWGQGPERERLQAMIHQRGLSERILLRGVTRRPLEMLQSGKVFLLTSVNEGFPNALAEAMSMSLPCIAVDCPTGPKDLLSSTDDESPAAGVLIPREDKKAFSEALIRLIEAPERQIELGQRAKRRISSFEASKVINQWTALLERL